MKRTATVRRKHEIEQALEGANAMLVECIRCSNCTRHLSELKHIISDLNALRFDMLADHDLDHTQRANDIEAHIRSLMPREFTATPGEPPGPT